MTAVKADIIREHRVAKDLLFLATFVIVALGLSLSFDLFDRLILWTRKYEEWEVDELLSLTMLLSVAVSVFALRRWSDLQQEITLHQHTEEALRQARNGKRDTC